MTTAPTTSPTLATDAGLARAAQRGRFVRAVLDLIALGAPTLTQRLPPEETG